MFNAMKIIMLTSYAHTMVKPPDPIRTPKLSTIGPAQYCGGGPRGNRRWCTFCHNNVPVAQWLRRVTTNHEIGGSSPSRNAFCYKFCTKTPWPSG